MPPVVFTTILSSIILSWKFQLKFFSQCQNLQFQNGGIGIVLPVLLRQWPEDFAYIANPADSLKEFKSKNLDEVSKP